MPGGPAVTELSVSRPSATVLAVTDGDPAIWVHDSATLVLHIYREMIHHGAEIALLRNLYLAKYDHSQRA